MLNTEIINLIDGALKVLGWLAVGVMFLTARAKQKALKISAEKEDKKITAQAEKQKEEEKIMRKILCDKCGKDLKADEVTVINDFDLCGDCAAAITERDEKLREAEAAVEAARAAFEEAKAALEELRNSKNSAAEDVLKNLGLK